MRSPWEGAPVHGMGREGGVLRLGYEAWALGFGGWIEGKDKMMGFRVVYARVMGGILEKWPRHGLGSVVWACHQLMEDLVEFHIACSAVQGLTGFIPIATVVECGPPRCRNTYKVVLHPAEAGAW